SARADTTGTTLPLTIYGLLMEGHRGTALKFMASWLSRANQNPCLSAAGAARRATRMPASTPCVFCVCGEGVIDRADQPTSGRRRPVEAHRPGARDSR